MLGLEGMCTCALSRGGFELGMIGLSGPLCVRACARVCVCACVRVCVCAGVVGPGRRRGPTSVCDTGVRMCACEAL